MPDLGIFSHFPVLGAALARCQGPVLELGTGDGSTPLIHYVCGVKRLYALSVDTDQAWITRNARYNVPGVHEFRLVNAGGGIDSQIAAWVEFCKIARNLSWGVCLVDQSPGEARVPTIMELKGCVDLFVVHDYEADDPPAGGNYGWKRLTGKFRYERVMRRIRPWTALLSDTVDFELAETDAWPDRCS